ncbi:MAG: helix-turn-helix domain-containing protein [Clostridia bacterium]|nr:helix-turn-helix domain-containing protein [Clostridia bacterium]
MEIGKKIKQIRLQRSLTQEELADRCELTKGYISQLENDLCSPSIATLVDILECLGVSLKEFFADNENEKVVFSQEDYFQSANGDGTSIWLVPNSQKNEMEPIILTLPASGSSVVREPFEGQEFGYVLQGKIKIVCEKRTYTVKKGEAFYLDGKRQHQLINSYKDQAKVLWVTTPSNF